VVNLAFVQPWTYSTYSGDASLYNTPAEPPADLENYYTERVNLWASTLEPQPPTLIAYEPNYQIQVYNPVTQLFEAISGIPTNVNWSSAAGTITKSIHYDRTGLPGLDAPVLEYQTSVWYRNIGEVNISPYLTNMDGATLAYNLVHGTTTSIETPNVACGSCVPLIVIRIIEDQQNVVMRSYTTGPCTGGEGGSCSSAGDMLINYVYSAGSSIVREPVRWVGGIARATSSPYANSPLGGSTGVSTVLSVPEPVQVYYITDTINDFTFADNINLLE
jgi:hypothetical protein